MRLGTKFAVDNAGNLVTKHLIVDCGNTDFSPNCWIGNWQFTNENLGAVYKVNDSRWDRLWLSTHGLIQAEQWNKEPFPQGAAGTDYTVLWSLNTDGTATFSNLNIPTNKNLNVAGTLTVTGSATISGSLTAGNNTVTLDSNGLTATSGSIGGFTISGNQIGTTGATYLTSNIVGAVSGKFNNLYINNTQFPSMTISAVTGIELYPDDTVKSVSTSHWQVLGYVIP